MNVENPDSFPSGTAPIGSAACLLQAEEEDRNQEHFKTDHLLPNLKRHTISSGVVTISAQGAKFGLSLISTVILARLLTPRDFGLVAIVATVTTFLRVFKDAGLSTATVQRESITHIQVSNLFWINVAVSVLSTLIVAGSAPLLAWFYHDSQLVGITLCLSITFLISGSTVQHQALLKRQLRFKAIALIEVGSMAIGVIVGIIMAVSGRGYWSLVGSTLAMETAGLLLTWSVSRWRPRLPARRSGIGPLVSFGANQTAGGLIFSLARGCDNLLIGWAYGADSVGLYSRASALLLRPMDQFLSPINAVFVPALSRLQFQSKRYRATFLRLYEAIALTAFLFTGLFLALAYPLTLAVLGPKWGQAAPIFGGFTIAALYLPLTMASTWLLISQGRGKDLFRATSILAVLTLASFVVGLPFGPVGVATAFSVSGLLIRLPILYHIVGRRGPVSTADLWMGFFRHLPLWIVVCVVTWLTRSLVVNLDPLVQLLICAPVGVLAGSAFICSFAPQRKVATDILNTVRELKKSP
jgi:O-antigen/teichoic acid export membrane protein